MIKLGGKIIDFYDDPEFMEDPRADQLFVEGEIPSFDQLDTLPDDAFAVKLASDQGIIRKFPLITKTAAEASAEYFLLYGGDLPTEVQRDALEKISGACRRHKAAKRTVEKLASYEIVEAGDEPTLGTNFASQVDEALYFRKLASLRPADRSAVAAAFCEEHGAEAFTKVAFWDYCPKEETGRNFDDAMEARRALLAAADQTKVAMLQPLMAEKENGDLPSFVEKLAQFDRMTGLDAHYGGAVQDPYVTCYGGQDLVRKEAAYGATRIIGDLEVSPTNDLARSLSALEDRFPRNSDSFDKMARLVKENYRELISTMPHDAWVPTAMYFGLEKRAGMEEGEATPGAEGSYEGMPEREDAVKNEKKRKAKKDPHVME